MSAVKNRHLDRDCRDPVAMDGKGRTHPCALDSLTRSNGSGNPRNDVHRKM
ncbi:hypothetical protein [Methylicorpusculum sp.]|uniref:hypothetical protein n=1 Tax=Methylicorpusculum sp. TaxID=2713644 RepID=UPI00271F4A1B|nr:hypothetical protein [Methylicorpusculum sp.]MDO8846588.1 hypothetical protein [Methylicorpusculum sp.]